MKGALEGGGKCIVVLPGNLQKSLADRSYSKYLENQQLVFLSASAPHSKPSDMVFRQHYDIACTLSIAVIIVRSGKNDRIGKCVRNCRERGSPPIWVRESEEEIPGNKLIVIRVVGNGYRMERM